MLFYSFVRHGSFIEKWDAQEILLWGVGIVYPASSRFFGLRVLNAAESAWIYGPAFDDEMAMKLSHR